MEEAARDQAPAAEQSLEAGADVPAERHLRLVGGSAMPERPHPLRAAREVKKLTQDGLARTVGCDSRTVSGIETGKKLPSVDLAARLADAVDTEVAALFGEPQPCACSPYCRELTFSTYAKRHYSPWGELRRRQTEDFDAYKRDTDLLGTRELAQATGLEQTSIARLARRGKLAHVLYPGEWNDASRPLLFELSAVDDVQRLQTIERAKSYRQRALAFHARLRSRGVRGTHTQRRGELRPCRGRDCDAEVYLHPYRLEVESAGYCPHCRWEHEWPRGLRTLAKAYYARTGSTAVWGKYANLISRAEGTRPGPKSKAALQRDEIYAEYMNNVAVRTIADRRGLKPTAVHRQIVAARDATKIVPKPLSA